MVWDMAKDASASPTCTAKFGLKLQFLRNVRSKLENLLLDQKERKKEMYNFLDILTFIIAETFDIINPPPCIILC